MTALRAVPGPDLLVFNYHRIRSNRPTSFDDELFGLTLRQFREQMEWLRRSRIPILSESELLEAIARGEALPRRSAMITFDDGYRDNYELAYPILRGLEVPAIFFIPTGAIEDRRLGPWDLVSYLVKTSPKDRIEFRGETFELRARRSVVARQLNNLRKTQAFEPAFPFLAELAKACGSSLPNAPLQDAELMTWEQLREISRNGITLASHTHTHPILAQISLAHQRQELIQSKSLLEARTGQRIRTFSYPDGNHCCFKLETKALVSEAGYSAAFSFLTGSNSMENIDRFDVRRLCPPAEPSELELVFSLPFMDYHTRKAASPAPRPLQEAKNA